jgi:hypothetical protein
MQQKGDLSFFRFFFSGGRHLHRFAPPTAPPRSIKLYGEGIGLSPVGVLSQGNPIEADSGIGSSIRVHVKAHINLQFCVNLSKNEMAGPAEQRMLDAGCCKACNLSASLAVSAAKRVYSPSPVPRRQPSRPIPMPMQPSIAFQQNCCCPAGKPISHHAHTSPRSESQPSPTRRTGRKSISASLSA